MASLPSHCKSFASQRRVFKLFTGTKEGIQGEM
jgi:hypothetical protein